MTVADDAAELDRGAGAGDGTGDEMLGETIAVVCSTSTSSSEYSFCVLVLHDEHAQHLAASAGSARPGSE